MVKQIAYTIRFIDSIRFMSSSLSSLVDNLAEGLHSNKCKYKFYKFCLGCSFIKNKQMTLKCLKCNKNYEK